MFSALDSLYLGLGFWVWGDFAEVLGAGTGVEPKPVFGAP